MHFVRRDVLYLILSAILLQSLIFPFQARATTSVISEFICELNGNERGIRHWAPSPQDLPCKITEKTGSTEKTLWSAENNSDFCGTKFRSHLDKLQKRGFSCIDLYSVEGEDVPHHMDKDNVSFPDRKAPNKKTKDLEMNLNNDQTAFHDAIHLNCTGRILVLEQDSIESAAPCRILEFKNNSIPQELWSAKNDPDFCKAKLGQYRKKLENLEIYCEPAVEMAKGPWREYRDILPDELEYLNEQNEYAQMADNTRYIGYVESSEYGDSCDGADGWQAFTDDNKPISKINGIAARVLLEKFPEREEYPVITSPLGEGYTIAIHIYALSIDGFFKVRDTNNRDIFYWIPDCDSKITYYSDLIENSISTHIEFYNRTNLVPHTSDGTLYLNNKSGSLIENGKYEYALPLKLEFDDRYDWEYLKNSKVFNVARVAVGLSNVTSCDGNGDFSEIEYITRLSIDDFVGWLDPYDKYGEPELISQWGGC